MRVFLSWSGKRSKTAAQGLRSLLDGTFPETVEVFISDNISAGEPWALRLQVELEKSQFGVLCLTQDNFQAPWVLFEAGAIAKKFDSARVVPYLIDGLPTGADKSPLAQFQHLEANREDTLLLVESINAAREKPQDGQRLERQFSRWWPDFEQTLKELPPPPGPADTPSDREVLEIVLQKVDMLLQVHQDSTGPQLRLPNEELAHLLNLRHQPTVTYSLTANLRKELRHLRDQKLIKNKKGPIGQLPEKFQLDTYFELSESGQDYLRKFGAPQTVSK
jgi:TIR domain